MRSPHRSSFLFASACAAAVVLSLPVTHAQSEEAERIEAATGVLREAADMPDHPIPQSVMAKAEGVIVIPAVKKGGFVLAGQWGRGILSARSETGASWSAPGFVTLTGGSVGLQVGGQEVDLVLIVNDRKGLERLVSNQFKLGVDASVAAGPVGREAQAATDVQMRAKILSYSRARGLFAGVALNAGTLREDVDANERFYGRRYSNRDIALERLGGAPHPVPAWRDLLTRVAAR